MRVSCYTVEEFVTCFQALLDAGGEVYEQTVRVSIVRRAKNESKAKFDVLLQATLVAQPLGGGEYLLEVGYLCGSDFEDATQEKEGSTRAQELKEFIVQVATERRLKVLPGLIGI